MTGLTIKKKGVKLSKHQEKEAFNEVRVCTSTATGTCGNSTRAKLLRSLVTLRSRRRHSVPTEGNFIGTIWWNIQLYFIDRNYTSLSYFFKCLLIQYVKIY